MKKSFMLFISAAFIFLCAGMSEASVDNIYEVAIVSIAGDVQVDTNADGTWIRPWVGLKLMEDAVIKTGEGSTTDIVFDAEGLNIVRVQENSLTTVKSALLELPEGNVLVNFANLKPGSSFTVRTPTAACAIRGSAMGVMVAPDGTTTVVMILDNGYIQPLDADGNPVGEPFVLPPGNKIQIGEGGDVGGMEGLDPGDTDDYDDFVGGLGATPPGTPDGTEDTGDFVDTKDVDDAREDDTRIDVEDDDDSSQISPTEESPSYIIGE